MYSAIFTLAYFACMRMGEVVLSTEEAHAALISQLTFQWEQGVTPTFLLRMKSFKFSKDRKVTLRIRPHQGPACPVSWLCKYLLDRPHGSYYLFCHPDGRPVTRKQVSDVLSRVVVLAGLDARSFGSHSFRIGRCTDLMQAGLSDAQIRTHGRWASNAFRVYVRPDVVEC